MNVWITFLKTFRENLREWKILVMALSFAPAFVFMMHGYFSVASPAYRLLVINLDTQEDGTRHPLLRAWEDARHTDGTAMFLTEEVHDLEVARDKIERREADLLVVLPAGFLAGLHQTREQGVPYSGKLVNHYDQNNPRGAMAMALSDYVAYSLAFELTATALPFGVEAVSVGGPGQRSEFDLYVPALLVLAIIMILFTAAASLIKEVDKKTLRRLMLSPLRTGELLAAVALNQVLLGTVALALAYLAAYATGYRDQGSLPLFLLVGAVTSLAVVAVAVLTAAFLSTIFELLTVGVFPFFVLMFFSECMFPLPKIPLGTLLGQVFYLNDVLPTALAVRAFNKILNFGAGFQEIALDLAGIVILGAVYFAAGAWLFQRRHMRV
ncbi:MAG: hypothetical protein A2284_14075 [Deltaproteobacteria bacterium RIFOXYA12_FULL_61_11]|nr:MAG: hypothetical protein A2284_14075 [Deltaproteobacteria bacterium RIFOXYA12_FULL_61_11]